MKFKLLSLFLFLLGLAVVHQAAAQGTTAFTYQGQLRDGGTNANGAYSMTFALYDAATGGNQIGSPVTTSPALVNGLFTVNLDFGAGAFTGNARWLDITVAGETLTPRAQVLPTPYAQYAGSAAMASTLASGNWNASVGTFQNHTGVFGIFANNSLVLGLTTNGIMANGALSVSELTLGSNGGALASDGNGGVVIYNSSQLGNGNLTVSNLTLNGSSLQFPAQSGANIAVNANGDFTFDNNITISSLGVLKFPGPSGGSSTISGVTGGLLVNGTVQFNNNISIFGNVYCNNGAFYGTLNGNVNQSSDRNLKEKFTPIDSREVLDRVAKLPISSWNYKADETTRHLGPMAQDFYTAFNLGTDDKHIATVDEGGVALAAIQGLHALVKEKDAEIADLKQRLEALEHIVLKQK